MSNISGTYNYNYKRALRSLFVLIADSSERRRTLLETSKLLRAKISRYDGLSPREKYRIYSACYDTARIGRHKGWEKEFVTNKVFSEMFKACRSVQAAVQRKEKKAAVKEELRSGNTIFFLCSSHKNCASDHIDYQGKIYVDRFWRQKVSGAEYRAVASYISNRYVSTIQGVMGEPVYMTTRPYCKHYFIPLDTATVLSKSVNSIRKELEKRKPIDTDYREEYYEVRQSVFAALEKAVPCKEFRRAADKKTTYK